MNTAEKIELWISEPMSWAEIRARYPDQWVCLVEMEYDKPNDVTIRSARVIWHGTIRRAALAHLSLWRQTYTTIGHRFTGTIKPPRPRYPQIVMTDEIRELLRAPR